VEGMRLILQSDTPDTFVLATHRTETVRKFVELAFLRVGIEIAWSGKEDGETGIDRASGKILVRVNEAFYRPAEVELLLGDPTKANTELGWRAETKLEELAGMMVDADVSRNENGNSF
jgi:GDPmannose 4,6-dehydratase